MSSQRTTERSPWLSEGDDPQARMWHISQDPIQTAPLTGNPVPSKDVCREERGPERGVDLRTTSFLEKD